jgi:hypothetical protein
MFTPFNEKWSSWLKKIGWGSGTEEPGITPNKQPRKERPESPHIRRVWMGEANRGILPKRVGIRDRDSSRSFSEKKKLDPKGEHYDVPHRRHKPVWHGHH